MRDVYKSILKYHVISQSVKEIPENKLAQQQFDFRFDSYTEQTHLYNEDLTKMLAISVVPENIVQIGNLEMEPQFWPAGK